MKRTRIEIILAVEQCNLLGWCVALSRHSGRARQVKFDILYERKAPWERWMWMGDVQQQQYEQHIFATSVKGESWTAPASQCRLTSKRCKWEAANNEIARAAGSQSEFGAGLRKERSPCIKMSETSLACQSGRYRPWRLSFHVE